ncbi:putative tetratricopeptide repeat domain protein [Botrytis fragariae]|uniref:Putative tetratricopeptide repeat domain protein n=1 Tax=Botrytis fragariae TaxID=1964551 RepID=A0A8H6ALN3_9HELO|nr:putative tetratricopeptide repeat domain protein [Botrytis fragariae]KAF5869876.1 putative tetratricopeptide repeat domain protein [Botrytis fragariae]
MSDADFPFPEPLPETLPEVNGHVIRFDEGDGAGDRWREASHSTASGNLRDSADSHNGDSQAIRSNVQTDYVELPLPFECDRCPRSFYRAEDLQWHKYKHAAGLAFNCDECEGMFPTNDDLEASIPETKHISTNCKNTGYEQQPEGSKASSFPLKMQRYDLSASHRENPKPHDFVGLKTAQIRLDPVELDSDDGTRLKFRREILPSETLPAAVNREVSPVPCQSTPDQVIEHGEELSAASELVPVEISRTESGDLTIESFETFEEMKSRHCREFDDLQRRITQKKYLATDETRIEINRLCEDMERRLKKRQFVETPLLVDQDTRNRRRTKQLKADGSKEYATAICNIDSELQWIETEKALLQTLEAKQIELGPDDISTIDTVKNTARVYFDQGKLVEAEHMYLRALNGYKNASGPTQMLINAVMNNLGRIYYRQGNVTKAEEMYVQALANFERYLGNNHPTTRNTANRLGHVYQKQGKLQEAQRLFGQSTAPVVESSPDIVKNGAAGMNILQSDFKQRDNLTGTRKFTSNNIRDLGKAFRNIDDSHNVSSQDQFEIVRWSTSEDASLLRTIARLGLEDWPAVSTVVGSKTADQCHYRYLRFEKSFGIDPTSSDKSSQIKLFMAAVEKNSSSELAHWLRDHRNISEDGDDIVSRSNKGSVELEERSNEAPSTPGSKSPVASKSFGNEEFTHWKNAMESRTHDIGIQSNPDTHRKSSSQLSAELGHDGYRYTKPMPERTAFEIAELRAERRADIERRCAELDPPLTKELLASMPSYRTTIQDVRPLTELGWEFLKRNFLAERTMAELESSDLSDLPPIKRSYNGSGRENTDDMVAERDLMANEQQKAVADEWQEGFSSEALDSVFIESQNAITASTNEGTLSFGRANESDQTMGPTSEAHNTTQFEYSLNAENGSARYQDHANIYDTNIAKRLRRSENYHDWAVVAHGHGLESLSELTRATVGVNANLPTSQGKNLKVSDSVMAEQEEHIKQYTSEDRMKEIVKLSQHQRSGKTWTHTPEIPANSQIVDSQDIKEKLAEMAIVLAKLILEKSQWLGQMDGDELDHAITMLGNEVHSKLHEKGWPRTTLAMYREVHIKAIRDLLIRHRKDRGIGSSTLLSSTLSENSANNDSHSRLLIEDIPDDQSDNSFEFSATDSVVSVADSIFSAMSLATGSSMSSFSVSQTATDRLVRLLLEDAIIKPLCEDALQENGMSRERFERNLSRLLKGFAIELRKEAQTREQRQAAHLVRFRARNSAHMICSTLRTEKEQKGSNHLSDSSGAALLNVEEEEMECDLDIDDDSDSASESSEDASDDFQHLELFVKDSKAFELFREKLRIFIHPQRAQLTIASTPMVASRRNSLSSKTHNWTIALPEMPDDVKDELFATPKDVGESRTQLMALNNFQLSSADIQSDIVTGVYQTIWQKLALFSDKISISGRPPVAIGKTRVEWRCKCGQRIYDDFTELRPGAANRLKQALTNDDSGSTDTNRSSMFSDCSKSFSKSLSSIFAVWASNSSSKSLSSGLPTHEPSKNQLDSNNPNIVKPIPLPVENVYLLLCYPSGRYATRLLQLGLHNLEPKSDQSLFTILRTNYKSMRGRFLNLISLKSLKSIKFVHFEMYRSSLIDVRQKDVIPPPDHIEYRYSPAPPEVIPPIGDNHLMHLFLHPDHADEDTVCLDRFPKKLKEKLSCKRGQPTNFGWGLEFVEGWDMKSIWIVAFIVFGIGSLLLGILWAVYKHSIQDAFTIAGYMVSFTAIRMIDSKSPILKPPTRVRSRPSTPGASFLHTASLSCPTRYPAETREVNENLTPNTSASSPLSPVKIRKLGEPERALRSKTSLTLSLPEEETFGQFSIDLPGSNIARDFGFGSGAGSGISRIEERRSVVFVEETRENSEKIFEGMNLDAHKRKIGDRELGPESMRDEAEATKQRCVSEMLDRREDDEEDKCNRYFGRFGKVLGYLTSKDLKILFEV